MKLDMEYVTDVWPEMDQLLHDYFNRTIAKEGLPPLHMNWLVYIKLNAEGNLLLFTARGHKADELLGFVMYHTVPHLHHIGVMNAACDILAVSLDQRGNGIAREMMEFAEPILKKRGANYVTHQFRTCYDTEPLFPKLGYRLIEHGYLKELN